MIFILKFGSSGRIVPSLTKRRLRKLRRFFVRTNANKLPFRFLMALTPIINPAGMPTCLRRSHRRPSRGQPEPRRAQCAGRIELKLADQGVPLVADGSDLMPVVATTWFYRSPARSIGSQYLEFTNCNGSAVAVPCGLMLPSLRGSAWLSAKTSTPRPPLLFLEPPPPCRQAMP